jgi:hypothetical protein
MRVIDLRIGEKFLGSIPMKTGVDSFYEVQGFTDSQPPWQDADIRNKTDFLHDPVPAPPWICPYNVQITFEVGQAE